MLMLGVIVATLGRSTAFRPAGVVGARAIHVYKSFTNSHSIADKDNSKSGVHLQSILDGNLKWVDEQKRGDPEFFDKLAKPQTPKYLYFGCADSRVPANEILGKG